MNRPFSALQRGSLAFLTVAAFGLCGVAVAADPYEAAALEPASFGEPGGNLVFTPITPCRLLDSRGSGQRTGKIPAGNWRGYSTRKAFLDSQGGDDDTCGLSLDTQHEAVVINLTAVDPTQAGFLTAWPVGEARPLAATLSYEPGQNVSNEVIVPINIAEPILHFSIYSYRDIHVVADLVGYLSPPEKAALDCVEMMSDAVEIAGSFGNATSPFCPATHTATGGSCLATSELSLVTTRKRENVDQWFCSARRTEPGIGTLRAAVQCCATPGR